MARKKQSSNKLVPVLALAAILGGGYYWLTSDSGNSSGLTFPSEHSNDSAKVHYEAIEEQDTALQDTPSNVTADAEQAKTDKESAKQETTTKTKNAYIDEYGNTIYTTPNGETPIQYRTAKVGRWGYSFKYPSFLTKERNTSDGRSYEDGKGKKLTTYASWNVFNESISELYRKDFPDAKSVTYKKLFKKQKCYVKSGYTKNNQIYYMKEAIIGKDDQEVVVTLVFYYPQSYNKQAGKVIGQIFPSFPL